MGRAERFKREIQQGLRSPEGAFLGDDGRGLNIGEFADGYDDFKNKRPFPDNPTVSYEIGRTRAYEEWEETQAVLDRIAADEKRRDDALREMLKDRPDLLAEYDAKIAAIREKAHG